MLCRVILLRLEVIQSECLQVIGNHTRRTHTSQLHNSLNIEPIPVLIHRLTDKIFRPLPLTLQPPSPINMELADLTNLYIKCKHKRTDLGSVSSPLCVWNLENDM